MAIDITLKIDGVNGESKVKNHEGEIDVLAWNWGMSQSGTMHVGGGGGAGKVNIQDVSITKYIDKASTNLIRKCCNGSHMRNAVLTVRKAGQNPIDYLVITMSPVLVASVSTGGNCGEDRLMEKVTLNFSKVKFSYTPQKEDGSADAVLDLIWDIEKNTEDRIL